MKNKAIIILMVLILFSLVMTSVSASDVNTTEEISRVSVSDVNTTYIISASDTDDVINDYSNDERHINNSIGESIDYKVNEQNSKLLQSEDTINSFQLYINDYNKLSLSEGIIQRNDEKNEILGIGNDDVLGANELTDMSITYSGIDSITITYEMKGRMMKENWDIKAWCQDKTKTTTISVPAGMLNFNTFSISITGPFTPGSTTVYLSATYGSYTMQKSASCTISKATPTGISVTGGNDYTFGTDGSPVVYAGKVNGQKGTVSMAGNVYIYQNAKHIKTITCNADGSFTYSLDNSTDLLPSQYTYTCYYAGNTYYNGYGDSDNLQATKTITVSKFTPDFTIGDKITINYNQTDNVVVNGKVFKYSGDYYGNIDLYIGDELVGSDIPVSSDGSWSYTLSSTRIMPSNNVYSVKVEYKGSDYSSAGVMVFDDKYSVSKGMIVPSINPTGNIDIGDTEYVEVTVVNAVGTGNVAGITVSLSGTGIDVSLVNVSDSNGMVVFSVSNLPGGKYDDWKVSVIGNDYYNGRVMNVKSFSVQSPVTVIITNVSPADSTYPDEIIITGFVVASEGVPHGNVTLILGGENYTGFLDVNANFTAHLTGVKPGIYNNITVKYNPTETEYYRGVESTVSITETIINKYLPTVVFDSINVDFDSYPGNATITGLVTYVNNQIPTGRVEVIYNGKVYGNSTLDSNGEFTIYATDLPRGEYNLTINYSGDDYYLNNTNTTTDIVITPSDVNFTIGVNNATYNVDETSTTIDVILTGLYGGDNIAKGIVRLEVGDKHWDATLDDTGKATIEIKSLNAGDYSNAVLKYIISNDEQSYRNTTTAVDFAIYKADPGLSVRAPTIGAGKDGSIYITLHDNTTGEIILTVGTTVRVTLNITGGANRTYVIAQPPVGANQVIANYTGDVNFNSSVAETMLYIERPESYLNYTVTNITYGQSEDLEFKIYLDEELTKLAVNATGTIRIYGLDKNYKVDVVDGLGYLSVSNLTKGNWTVVAIYSGNDELGGSDKENRFAVTGVETPLSITVNNNSIIAGDDIIVTVTINGTINDPVQLFVNNRLYYTNTTVNGVVSFVLRNLSYGNYNISALFNGNSGFEAANNNTTVTVSRTNVNPFINITYGRDIGFNITVPDEATGYIKIKGNGTDESVTINDCEAVLTLDKVARGNYKFNISYDGNWKYLPFNIEKTFTIGEVDDYVLNITSTEAVFNRTVDISVTAFNDLEGKTINLTVDGTTKAVATVINGVATFNNVYLVSNSNGEFEVIAHYDGDDIYGAKSFTATVPVIPTDDYVLGLKALDLVYVGDDILINITAPDLITTLNITINGRTQLIPRSNFTYRIDDIDEGEYTISISYAGDKAYTSKNNSTTFSVIKKDSIIIIKVDNTHYGEDAVINISVTDGATGYVLVTIDNKTGKYDLVGNSTQIISKEYAQGLHNINVSYVGDRKYNPSNNVSSFTVFKASDYNMTVYENETLIENNSVLHKFVDHTLVVDVVLPDDATGNLTFILYDKDNHKISNWTTILPKNLINYELRKVTNYTLEINYSGDSNYESKSFKFEINVHQFLIDANATFTDNPYFVLSDSKINISSNLNNRQLRVYIDGVYYSLTDIITNNKTVLNLGKLSAGNHTISLMYNGDVNYTSLFTTHNITVSKLNSSVNITASSVRTGNPVIIDVNASGNGSANIIIFNNTGILGNYNITVNNGKGSFIVPIDFTEGSYNVNVTYYGDDIYYSNSNSTLFTVSNRIVSTLNITRPTFIVNKPSTVSVTSNFPSGIIEVYVDGVKQNNVTISSGKGTISLDGLSAGDHTILVGFAGDYNYTDLTTSFDIFVEKLNSTVNVSASSVRTGNPVIINVNASGNGSANIVVLNGTRVLGSYNITVNNGKGSFIVPIDFTEGSYNLNVTYNGDDIYYGSKNNTPFTVTNRIVSVLNFTRPIFIVNKSSIINVSSNFPNGVIEVYVDGVKQNNVTITSTKGTISLAGLSAGDHNVLVTFAGDYNYTDLTTSFDIFVEKLNSTVNVSASSVRTGNPVIVDVNASGSGFANIVIYGSAGVLADYNITINGGKGSFIVPVDFVGGDYNVNVIYYGDDIYYGSTNTTSFTVSDRIISALNFTKPVFIVNRPSIVNVSSNFPNGVIEVYVDGVKQDNVTITGTKGAISLAGLSAGDHTVLVTFAGDYNYTDLTTSFDIFVEKLNSTVNVSASSVRTGNPVIIEVNASGNGSANIIILNRSRVIGNYNITITNGKSSFILPVDFAEGNYNVNITYYGDDIYYGSSNTTSFIISDRIITVLNFTKPVFIVNRPSTVNVSSNFPNGVIEVYVDGVKQDNVTIAGTKGAINLAGLSAGDHTVLVSFAGDYNYTDLTTSFDIFVEKLNSTVNVTASSVRTGNPVIVDVNASGNGSANIIIFNDTDILCEYNITINDGKGYLQIPYTFINGTYNLNITYFGDDIYYGSNNSAIFIVSDRINSTLNIDKFNFTVNTPDDITVSSNFPTGNVEVYIDGVKSNDITIDNFEGEINLNPLSVGNHTILLIYHGDYDYTNLTTSFKITVFKLNSTVNVSATNVRTGNNVIIDINASGDGIANIVIYNEFDVIGNYNATIDNGRGSFIVPYNFADGSYLVNVTYLGDDTYYGSFNYTDFIVSDKIFSTLKLDKHEVIVNTPDVLEVSSNFKSGTVNVYVDGKRQDDIYIVNNKSEIRLGALTVGEHNILLIYSGDYNYSSLTTSFRIVAYKYNSTVKVTGNDKLIYNNSVVLDIELNNTSTDAMVPDAFVDVTVYYANGSVAYNNSMVSFTNEGTEYIVSDLMAGDYYAIVTYPGNENFTGNVSERFDFSIAKASTSITANIRDSTFSDSITVEYVIHNNNNTGAVISNENVNIKIYNKTGSLVYSTNDASFHNMVGSFDINDYEFISGNYTVNITYAGNENFTGNYTVITFEVSKTHTMVSVNVNNTTFNQTVIIRYNLSNINAAGAHIPNGNVNVNIIDQTTGRTVYTNISSFISEKGVVRITDFEFASGNYSVTVTYDGDMNFLGNSTKSDFTVLKARTAVAVNVNNITFNQNVIIRYNLTNINATNAHIPNGNVRVNITNKTSGKSVYTGSSSFSNEKGVLEITDFEFATGNYIVNVIYEGSENFTGNSSKFTFTVSKARTDVSVNVNDTTYNQNVIVEYNLSNVNGTSAHIPDGDVIVTITNKANGRTVYTHSSSFANEKCILKITDFEFGAGNYLATVTYDGNENFAGNSTKFDFTVSKARTSVSANANNTTFNQNVIIEYGLTNINGTNAHIPDSKVTVNIINKASGRLVYSNNRVSFSNEKGVLEITDYEFATGDYSVSVVYDGNENFTGNSTKFDFSVSKARTAVAVNVNNTTFNQRVIVDFSLSNINGTNAHIPNSKVTINIINKETGSNVYSKVVSFADEKGALEIVDFEFASGNYTVTVTYDGNDNFIGNSTLFDFSVFKARTAVSVNVNNTTFNQNVIVEYNLSNINSTNARIPNSYVNINIINKESGVSVYNMDSPFANGKGVLKITDFEFGAGNYSVTVTYNGNDNFAGNSTKFNFTVSKARTNASVKVNSTIFNNTVVIEYALINSNGTSAHIPDSTVTITVTDKGTGRNVYTNISSFVGEKGVVRISDFEFAQGNYSVTVAYAGNENFVGTSAGSEFTVSKARTAVSVSVNNTIYSQIVVVKYNLSNIDGSDAHIPDSQVTINIINKETGQIVYSKVSSFSNEEGILSISDFDFTAGNYIANVTYDGNVNFIGSSNSVPFTVSKAHTSISVNVNNTTFNQKVAVEYTVDATVANIPDGNVVINITQVNSRKIIYSNNASFVNGKGVFSISDYEFAAGDYTVTVGYGGNENFIGNSTKFNFTVNKARTGIVVNVNDTIFNQTVVVECNLSNINGTSARIPNGRVLVTVVDKETGMVVYSNGRVSFVDGRAVFSITDFEFSVGDYAVNVSYAGNANFTGSSTLFDFTVSKAHSDVSVNVNDTTFNQNVVIEYALENIDGTGARIPNSEVIVTVMDANGNAIYYTTSLFSREKGILRITDFEFNVGDYTVNVTYNGTANFDGSSTLFDFSVSKAHSSVSVNVNNVTFNQGVTVEYSLGNANGTGAHIPDGDVNVTIVDKSTGNTVYHNISSFIGERGVLVISDFEFSAGNYSANVTYNGGDNFMGNSSIFDFSVSKARTHVSVNVNSTTFNNTLVIEYALDNIDTNAIIPDGDVSISVINKSNGNVVYNGVSSFVGEKGILDADFEFAAGNYSANVTYNGGDNFIGSSSIFDFTVSKARTSIVSNASNVIFNEDVEFNVDITNIDTGAVLDKNIEVVTVDIIGDNGYSYHNISSINDANRVFSNLGAGRYDVTVKYNGSSNFFASNDVKFTFTVSPASTRSVVSANNVSYDNHVTVFGDVYNQVTSADIGDYDMVNISVYDNDKLVYSANASVGSLRSGYVLPFLNAGVYTVTSRYYNSENFTESRASAEFIVSRANSDIQFNDDYVVMGNDLSFTVVNITDGRTITLKVNNRIYTGSVVDGVGYVLIDSGDSGIFDNVLVAFAGDTNYNPSNSMGTVKFIHNDSFTALQLLIDANTNGDLILNNNYVFDPNTDDVNGINLNKSININGDGYAIDATGAHVMFNVTGGDVSIGNVSVSNVDIYDNGSVVIWSGDNGCMDNVDFINNNFSNGTVIDIECDGLMINNSSFTNNSGINGDIIRIDDVDDTTISNSKFNNNDIVNGAVISVDGCENTVISNSSFTDNDVCDGVIIDIVDCDDTAVTNTSFVSNDLSSNSIVIDVSDSDNTNIKGVNFTNTIVSGNSSVVNIDDCNAVNLTDITFNNDIASDDSSIVIIDVSDNVELDGITVDSCSVDGDNRIMEITNSTVTISNSFMTNNTADKGNVVTVDFDSKVYLDNVTTSDNTNNNKHRDITYETFVLINSSDIYAGEDAVVNVSVVTSYPYDVKGIMIIMGNGDNYYFTLTDDKGSFSIPDLKGGVYNITGVYMGNQYIDETSSNTVMINVIEVSDFDFTVNNTNITTSGSLIMNLPADASGNVSAVVGNDTFVVPVINGKAVIDGDKLPLGSNQFKANYSGDDKYTSKILSDVISVKCNNYDIAVLDKTLIYDDDLVVVLPKTASGNLSIIVGNKSFNVPVNNGKVIIPGDELPLGYSNVSISYSGDDKYVPGASSETISVRLDNCTLDVESDIIVEGDDLVIILPADASGNVSVVIGNDTFVVPVVDGKANVSTVDVLNGDYNISVSYSGSDIYVPVDMVTNISIVSGVVVTAPDVIKYYGGSERFIVNVANIKGVGIANKSVNITVNGVGYSRLTNENGDASFPINLPAGEYVINVTVDDMFLNSSVIVKSTIVGDDLVKVYKNDSQYCAVAYDSNGDYLTPGSLVVFNINGVFYHRYVGENGIVKLNINLLPGSYVITANNTVTGDLSSNVVTVIPRIINNYDVVKYFLNDTQYYVTLIGDDGNPVGAGVSVTFNINGVFYTRQTNANGVAMLNINLPEGSYIITAEYAGYMASNNIVVLPTLTAGNLAKYYGDNDQFVVNVFDGQGNPSAGQSVTFNINGVFYTRVSDINGQARLNINLPVGEYIITSTYGGTSISNKVNVL